MPRSLPPRPSLEYVRKEAKHLLAAHRSGDASVCDVLRLHHRFQGASDSDILAADVSLQQAQHALAKEYGFDSWAELKSQVNQRGPVSKSGRAFSDGREPYGHRLTEELPPSHAARWLAQNCEEGSSSLIVDAGCGDGRNTAKASWPETPADFCVARLSRSYCALPSSCSPWAFRAAGEIWSVAKR